MVSIRCFAASLLFAVPALLVQPAAAQDYVPTRLPGEPNALPIANTNVHNGPPHTQPGYPQLDAPMNPVPHPNIPVQMGAVMITNQALAPQEMLYPHHYRALYPPYYYKVKGDFFWTPFGMRSHEKWTLQGTMVDVKYKPKWGWLSFRPPYVK